MNRPPHTTCPISPAALLNGALRSLLVAILGIAVCYGWEDRIVHAQGKIAPAAKDGLAPPQPPPAAAENVFNPGPGDAEPPVGDKGDAAELDPNDVVPKGFRPRGEIAPAFNIKEEWIYQPFDGNKKAISEAKYLWAEMKLKGDVPTAKHHQVIEELVRYRLSLMTLKDARDFKATPAAAKVGVQPAFKIREGLVLDVTQAFNNARQGQSIFHRALLEAIVKEVPKLYKYHFITRLNAAILLSELNIREREPNGTPEVPYYPANAALLKLLEPPKPGAKPEDLQPEAVKVWAVNGLVRIAEMADTGELNAQVRHSIVETLIRELEGSGSSHYWYQMRLAEGLGRVNYLRDRAQRATIPQALLKVLVDEKRHPLVRAEAAQALGRIQYDSKVNASLIAADIAKFAVEVGNNALKKPPTPEWGPNIKLLAVKLYMAFKPINKDERPRGFGLLNTNKTSATGGVTPAENPVVKQAYAQVLPLVTALIKDNLAAVPGIVTRIEAWLKANPPKDQRVSPEMPPLARHQARRPLPDGPAQG